MACPVVAGVTDDLQIC